LSLESGSYTFRASFIGNKYYESAVSNDLPVKFGIGWDILRAAGSKIDKRVMIVVLLKMQH